MPCEINYKKNFEKLLHIAKKQKQQALFVFDLDSTLLCVKNRTQHILHECAKDKNFIKLFPNQARQIQQIQTLDRDWYIKDILSRHNLHANTACLNFIECFWKKRFFSNDYLYLDQPYPFCINFLHTIIKYQSSIVYLTARSKPCMLKGSLKFLKKWNFPLKNNKYLFMKDDINLTDACFKTKQLKCFTKQYKHVVFIDNEPIILNQVSKSLPNIFLFWMNSVHSQKEKPPKKAVTLSMNYPSCLN